ncbi:hypothetical protein OCU04_004896 [Sclerotinia nivalis]|uniref:Uncharacterized protein n=1 Tax=Sclerotinia nivalis TaxID=352851 RepID=A0A9X0ARF1_9HELO|nr:hypothetical protein OCU04_004896 [Sclerotinia nivalis]
MRHWERQLLDWLEILQSANVDLEQYGKKEMLLFKRHQSESCAPLLLKTPVTSVTYYVDWGLVCEWGWTHVLGFRYGPRPEDWNFWLSEPTDQFAGDFWSLIEDPPLATFIPGAWVDYSPRLFRDSYS